mgnify:CR=1 FL=1
MPNNAHGNLSTVVESVFSKHAHNQGNGKLCHLCVKKHRVGNHNHSVNAGPHADSLVKGAPYYQPIALRKPSNTIN